MRTLQQIIISRIDLDGSLNTDSGSGVNGPGGGHVINVTDFVDDKTGRVSLDNEWSKKEDHRGNSVDLHDLYLCMGGSRVARLDAYCDSDEAHSRGRQAPVSELRVIRYDGQNGTLSDYAGEAGSAIERLAKNERGLVGKDRTTWSQTLATIVNTVPPQDKVALLKRIENAHVCSNEELGKLLAGAAKSVSFAKKNAIDSGVKNDKNNCIRATTAIAEYVTTLPVEIKKHYFAAMRGQ